MKQTNKRLFLCFPGPTNSSGAAPLPPSPEYILRGAESPVTVLEFTEPAGGMLMSGCQNGQVLLWDLSSRRSEESFDAHNGKPVLFLKSVDASKKLMTQGRDGYFKFWENKGPAYELDGIYIYQDVFSLSFVKA